MSCKVAEANAGVHSLAMAVAVGLLIVLPYLVNNSRPSRSLAGVSTVRPPRTQTAPAALTRSTDTIYTERYMDLPQANPEGYVTASISNVTGFRNIDFLFAHGSGDDNVHYANSAHLLDMLTQAQVRGFRFRMFTDRSVIPSALRYPCKELTLSHRTATTRYTSAARTGRCTSSCTISWSRSGARARDSVVGSLACIYIGFICALSPASHRSARAAPGLQDGGCRVCLIW